MRKIPQPRKNPDGRESEQVIVRHRKKRSNRSAGIRARRNVSRAHEFRIKRVYDKLGPEDGARFLVDRIWPRGISKKLLDSAKWLPDVAPSSDLRKWFGHEPQKWAEFWKRYISELKRNPSTWQPLLEAAETDDVTLLYSTRNTEMNQAVVLRDFLTKKIRAGTAIRLRRSK